MRFFDDLTYIENKKVFYTEPNYITNNTDKKYLSYALGATLYMPALREDILELVLENKYKRLTSMVLCMEDSIAEDQVEEAEQNIIRVCRQINAAIKEEKCREENLPLIFIRVRNIEQFKRLLEYKELFQPLTGFCFPKFDCSNGEEYLKILKEFNEEMPHILYGMPILESKAVIYKETRLEELLEIKKIIDRYKEYVLNIRLGGTDLLGLYSIRRHIDNSIYDIRVISDCISDIVNIFSRAEDEYVISGPVWEYFNPNPDNRILKPQLRQSPFRDHLGKSGIEKRQHYLEKCIDGLIKEVVLDKANSLIGKTIIHPSHISIVNALYVVTKEEYEDALAIIEALGKGAYKSSYSNKMNEINPHTNWANKILKRAYVYGVFNENKNYVDLF
ncbi:HpcH/HpaI aldolase/citrate lyase family protein [Clostridium ganghwense]|uniref:HpcH/HpaI aldolase/citrate lyase family protein n=1 Tax=Clostridium ganghwense TaxID=312089 RepID=A0ABT4CM13_9CLOT|nr:HpcH/HpaI aldolase/citrate lyase family protein [Clostridium ganghwense]MCY6370082.1 HpcH/HpaI aldolase/citrate lyase family protein [Clostridium ganghwense]